MQVIVKNVAEVPNKYAKLLKWKMYNLSEKFKDLLYVEAFINSEGNKPIEYKVKIRLGIPGHDIIITKKAESIERCIYQLENNAHNRLVDAKQKVTW